MIPGLGQSGWRCARIRTTARKTRPWRRDFAWVWLGPTAEGGVWPNVWPEAAARRKSRARIFASGAAVAGGSAWTALRFGAIFVGKSMARARHRAERDGSRAGREAGRAAEPPGPHSSDRLPEAARLAGTVIGDGSRLSRGAGARAWVCLALGIALPCGGCASGPVARGWSERVPLAPGPPPERDEVELAQDPETGFVVLARRSVSFIKAQAVLAAENQGDLRRIWQDYELTGPVPVADFTRDVVVLLADYDVCEGGHGLAEIRGLLVRADGRVRPEFVGTPDLACEESWIRFVPTTVYARWPCGVTACPHPVPSSQGPRAPCCRPSRAETNPQARAPCTRPPPSCVPERTPSSRRRGRGACRSST